MNIENDLSNYSNKFCYLYKFYGVLKLAFRKGAKTKSYPKYLLNLQSICQDIFISIYISLKQIDI